MYAVENPDRRWNSHAFACSRVVVSVVRDADVGPELAERIEGPASVEPVYVVVSTRTHGRRWQWTRSVFEQRRDAAAADERHDDVDAIG